MTDSSGTSLMMVAFSDAEATWFYKDMNRNDHTLRLSNEGLLVHA